MGVETEETAGKGSRSAPSWVDGKNGQLIGASEEGRILKGLIIGVADVAAVAVGEAGKAGRGRLARCRRRSWKCRDSDQR